MLCKISVFLFMLYTAQANKQEPIVRHIAPVHNKTFLWKNATFFDQSLNKTKAFKDAMEQKVINHWMRTDGESTCDKPVLCNCYKEYLEAIKSKSEECSYKVLIAFNETEGCKSNEAVYKQMESCSTDMTNIFIEIILLVSNDSCAPAQNKFVELGTQFDTCKEIFYSLDDSVKNYISEQTATCYRELDDCYAALAYAAESTSCEAPPSRTANRTTQEYKTKDEQPAKPAGSSESESGESGGLAEKSVAIARDAELEDTRDSNETPQSSSKEKKIPPKNSKPETPKKIGKQAARTQNVKQMRSARSLHFKV